METKLQLIFTLSTLISITGSSDVFGAVGESVQLEMQNPGAEFKTLSWIFNGSKNVLYYNKKNNDIDLSPNYRDRVEFDKETYSLTLKNLQKNDSGLYEVIIFLRFSRYIKGFTLSVFDPVKSPLLTFQQNPDSCNVTLTCRGHDLSIGSSCYNTTCEEKEVTSPGGVALSLSVLDSSIVCNHSNPISWKKTTVELEIFRYLCPSEDAVSPPAGESAGVSVCLVKTGLYSITLIILLSAVITVHLRERCNKSSN
ncbi:SLAM family member 7-like [Astyanax mexicanus]|uniref:SLAM family member 7-like n=1 Tax=Astyanax mexicanus TaxID=7994 RepID=A0A8T2KHU1_ASTMX|nr:SLAM family member 7-like [Astyanax mexicanus]